MKQGKYIKRDGKYLRKRFGDDKPERVTEMLGFESDTRILNISVTETGKVAISTTNKATGETVSDGFTRESFHALYMVMLNVMHRLPVPNLKDLDGYKFFDARVG